MTEMDRETVTDGNSGGETGGMTEERGDEDGGGKARWIAPHGTERMPIKVLDSRYNLQGTLKTRYFLVYLACVCVKTFFSGITRSVTCVHGWGLTDFQASL